MRQSFVTIAQSSQCLLNGNMQTHTHTHRHTRTHAHTHIHKYLHRYTTIRQTHAKTSILNILRHEWKFRKDED